MEETMLDMQMVHYQVRELTMLRITQMMAHPTTELNISSKLMSWC